MRDRWHQIEQSAREFGLDVHSVTSNFYGERDWHWLKDKRQVSSAGVVASNKNWERFKDEMMEGARFYSNDSELEDRIALGLGAAAYAIPYGVGRLFYDGALNVIEYGAWRVKGKAVAPSHPQGRKKNAHVLGAPIAVPFIALGVALEAVARVAGVSKRGGATIKLASKISANVINRYFGKVVGHYDKASLKNEWNIITGRITRVTDIPDIVGMVTLPLMIGVVEVAGAVLATGGLGIAEVFLRGLGFSHRGKQMLSLMGRVAGNILNISFPQCKSEINLSAEARKIFRENHSAWDIVNYPGMILPFALGSLAVVGAFTITAALKATRLLGFSKRGAQMFYAMGSVAAKILSPYFSKFRHMTIKDKWLEMTKDKNKWDVIDYPGMMTLPLIFGGVVVVECCIATATIGFLDVLRRLVGFSSRGGQALEAMGEIARFFLEPYFSKKRVVHADDDQEPTKLENLKASLQDIRYAWNKLAQNRSTWDIINYPGMILPLALGGIAIAGAALITTGIAVLDVARRLSGFSNRGAQVLRAMGLVARLVLEPYFYKQRLENIEEDNKQTKLQILKAGLQEIRDAWKKIGQDQSAWDIVNYPGMILPLALGGIAIAGACLVTAGIGILDGVRQAIGFSTRGKHTLFMMLKIAGNALSPYFPSYQSDAGSIKNEGKQIYQQFKFKDVIAFPGVMVSLAVGSVAVVGASFITGTVGLLDALRRGMGFSERGKQMLGAMGSIVRLMLEPYFSKRRAQSRLETLKAGLLDIGNAFKSLGQNRTAWDLVNYPGMTIPFVLGYVGIIGAALVTASIGCLDVLRRSVGFSKRGAQMLGAMGSIARLMLEPYFHKQRLAANVNVEEDSKLTKLQILQAGVQDIWNAWKKLGQERSAWDLVNYPGMILPFALGAVTVVGAALTTAGITVLDVARRALGFSERGKQMLQAMCSIASHILSPYFPQYYLAHIKDQWAEIIKNRKKWDIVNYPGMILPLALGGVAVVGATLVTAGIGFLDVIRRGLGFSERGKQMLQAMCSIAGNVLSPYFPQCHSANIKDQWAEIIKNRKKWDIVNYPGMTLPFVVGGLAIAGATLMTAGIGFFDILRRAVGISERAKSWMAVTLGVVGYPLGINKTNSALIRNNIATAKAPVRSFWHVCDVIGASISTAAVAIASAAAVLPLALLGFSKSNYHRFNYYRHAVKNAIQERRGFEVDYSLQEAHSNHWKACESPRMGYFFSKINLFNILGHALYGIGRYVIAPVVYAACRIFVKTITSGFGLVPLIKFCTKVDYDLSHPVDKVRKRFVDLEKSLDQFGHLPQAENSVDVEAAAHQANQRSFAGKIGFGLFSEGRRIISLGHTPEEKVLDEFHSKFEEYVRTCKRHHQSADLNTFFNGQSNLPNKERFSYDNMVAHIKQFFAGKKDREAVDQVARLIKNDIEQEIAGKSDQYYRQSV